MQKLKFQLDPKDEAYLERYEKAKKKRERYEKARGYLL